MNGLSQRRLVRGMLAFLVVLLVVLVARPAHADYSIDQVDIDATVATDGSLSVSETREFDFDGSYHGVYWEIPTGTYEGRQIQTTVDSVGEVVDGSFQAFEESSAGTDGTYQVTQSGSVVRVTLYSAHEDETARFVIHYTDTNVASRWADTAELYWKFVSDGWDVESQDVTCAVHLPVPDGSSVSAGDNVRAWGHGPLDASVSFSGNDVVYSVPGVGTDEYAEARIVFPAEWLSQVTASSESRLDTILSEEQQWADEANARRARARAITYGLAAACAFAAVVSVVVAVRKRRAYDVSHRPQFDDDYFRDVPSDDHPAVLGALLDDGTATQDGLSASLLRLADEGVVGLDVVTTSSKGRFGSQKRRTDYRIVEKRPLRRTPDASKAVRCADNVDGAVVRFLFETVGRHARHEGDEGASGRSVLVSDFQRVAKASPADYDRGYEGWKGAVEGACLERGFFTEDRPTGRGLVRGLGALDVFLTMVALLGLVEEALPLGLALGLMLVLAVAAVVSFVLASGMRELSSEAVELRAKLVALRRWLREFTHLEEAVPRDVVLWNRLLVMAVALGVSKEVIDQLKVAAPEVLEDPVVRPIYVWYGYYGGLGRTPAAAFGQAMSDAHVVSTAALSRSSDSSGGGFGGGFSGGGGGGFGGGGGGGAF